MVTYYKEMGTWKYMKYTDVQCTLNKNLRLILEVACVAGMISRASAFVLVEKP